MHSFSILAIGALAYKAMALTATFDGMTWGPVTVGQVWPIHWTVGDGDPVDLVLGNTTWNSPVFTATAATPPEFDWTVTVPDGFVPGNYGLVLIQGDGMDYSPLFSIAFPSAASSTSMSTTSAPTAMPNATLISATVGPTVTVTYWDHECGCTKTSAVPSAAAATNLPGTQYTWWDESCGCTKTAMTPVPTVAPGCSGSGYGCSNYTAPAAGTNMPPAPPSSLAPAAQAAPTASTTTYTGQAYNFVNPGFAVVGLVAAAVALLA
ncbi:hypothetical protein A1O1_00976 [Capronia coronata CBS 617.96]|uniref:Uncharacterized protein n=1 Tax=Capronia coronata CBS 617.96 TaxID=1182541 RepID=W9Z2S6_9EURO|nr:uncharacterized protein A1O1_00976 [Capronia coronata CBS 617.96]EXJ95851.1 hypothetical protein A1O1_00976 [Capronia coronata CBS 617.96]